VRITPGEALHGAQTTPQRIGAEGACALWHFATPTVFARYISGRTLAVGSARLRTVLSGGASTSRRTKEMLAGTQARIYSWPLFAVTLLAAVMAGLLLFNTN